MKTKLILVSLCLISLFSPLYAWGAGEAEAAASSQRGKYLAGSGIIIPEQEVRIDSYIAHIDYQYPPPKGVVGVSLYSGHRQVSLKGQEEIVHVGIQAGELPFAELPPMNLAFVIDKSGSMSAEHKMEWVKKAFDIFIERVRDKDFVSLVVFDNEARVVFPSTQMNSRERRLRFSDTVHRITPGGGTNLVAGLRLGYQEVLSNFRGEYTNRVLFLTDGMGGAQGMLDMAQTYREMGINVSTIGVGRSFNLELMVELSKKGGGSSRFISDMEEMERIFGSELDRMVVPAANDLRMKLEFLEDVEILGTWGYNNQVDANTIHYSQATLHHRDYETILAHVRLLPQQKSEQPTLARFWLSYSLGDRRYELGPYEIDVEYVQEDSPVVGFSNAMVLQSGTMLHFAQALKRIGQVYYASQEDVSRINDLRKQLWDARQKKEEDEDEEERTEVDYESLTSPEIQALEERFGSRIKFALDLTVEMNKELKNARMRLDKEGFDDEIGILEDYIRILGKELELQEMDTDKLVAEAEMPPTVSGRSVHDHVSNLFREMLLDIRLRESGAIAVSGFTAREGKKSGLIDLLNELGLVELAKVDNLTVVERTRLDDIMQEQQLSLSDLMDTSKAISVGKILSAQYILTGSLIEMPKTVVVFGRIVNVETAEVESVAQIIMPRGGEVEALLESNGRTRP